MRIALDSSVLIAAHISRAGVCAELLEDLLLHHELVISDFILEELRRKLGEKFEFPSREINQVVTFLRRVAVVVRRPTFHRTCAAILQTFRCSVLRLLENARC